MSKKPLPLRMTEDEPFFPKSNDDYFQAAKTLGKPEDKIKVAQDHAIANTLSLLEHEDLPGMHSFLGYAALQNIAQNGLIRACIETVADDMTRSWGIVVSESDELSNALFRALEEFDVQHLLHQVAEMVGYFGGCFLFIDTEASDIELQNPLDISSKSGEIGEGVFKGFRIIDPINVSPGEYNVSDPLKENFYKPKYWFVCGKRVHASRMIRFVANEVPQLYKPAYNFLGLAQAQILWDYVIHFNQCRVATAELLTKFSMTVMKTNLTEVLTANTGKNYIFNRLRFIAETRHNNSIIAIDKDMEDIVKIETPLGGLTDIGKQALEFLAAINRTPAVKLLGISPSGFNATGESDIRNYYDHLRAQREKLFKKGMRIILACIQLYVTGKISPKVRFQWNELGQDDEEAVASVQQTKANTMATLLDRGIISQEEARQYVAMDPDSGFAFIDPDKVPETEEESDDDLMKELLKGKEGAAEKEGSDDLENSSHGTESLEGEPKNLPNEEPVKDTIEPSSSEKQEPYISVKKDLENGQKTNIKLFI